MHISYPTSFLSRSGNRWLGGQVHIYCCKNFKLVCRLAQAPSILQGYHLHLTMPDKRKATMSPPSLKRPRISYDDDDDGESSTGSYERPRHHPLYGQKSAFPGLDDGGDELLYDDPEDGLEYLRMVRYA